MYCRIDPAVTDRSDDTRPAIHVRVGWRLGLRQHLLRRDRHGAVPARVAPHAYRCRCCRSRGCGQHHRAGYQRAVGFRLGFRYLYLVRGSEEGTRDHRGDGLADRLGRLLELRSSPGPRGVDDWRRPGGLCQRHCLLGDRHRLAGQRANLAARLRSAIAQQFVHGNRSFPGREGQIDLRAVLLSAVTSSLHNRRQPRCGHGAGSRSDLACASARSRRGRMRGMTNALTATLRTNRGAVVVRLFPDHAPKTVRNFVELAEGSREWTNPATRQHSKDKLYDGTIFHRVIPDFMIQGGDPLGTGTGGPGYKFADEIHPDLVFDRPYLLAMANAGAGTNGSQFFITTVPTPWLNRKHTIFGEVIEGANIVEEISRVKTQAGDRPVTDVVLESVTVTRSDDPPA